jgi:hypothetical protein
MNNGGNNTKKQFVIIGIILILFISICGCTDNSNKSDNTKKFIGTWEGFSYATDVTMNVTLTFYEDKTARQVSDDFHAHLFYFDIVSNSLHLTLQEFPDYEPIIYSYEFSNNDNSLTLTNVTFDTLVLTKV